MRLPARVLWAVASWVIIRRSGLFDLEWYQLQLEHRVSRRSVALAHYVLRGRRAGLSPHPLFEPSWYAPRDWQTRTADPFAAYLRRASASNAAATPHPLFDPAIWCGRHVAATNWPHGPLAHFVAHADPQTPMPISPALLQPFPGADSAPKAARDDAADTALRWGQARAGLEATVRSWRADERRRRAPRVSDSFDTAAERALIERCASAALPGGDAPLVSVVLPVRNRRVQVGEAIRSVQAQTMQHWELLASDDGSTDGTAQVLAEFAAADPRIRVFGPDSGTGPGASNGVSAARNRGIAQARGRYVAFLDSDNTWTPPFLQTMLTVLLEEHSRFGYAAAELRSGDGVRFRNLDAGPERAMVLELLAVSNHIDLNVLVVERGLLTEVGGFDQALRRTVDYDLVWRLAEREVPRYVPMIGVRYDAAGEAADRITVRESPTWREVVKNQRLIDWPVLQAAANRRDPDLISVLVAATTGWPAAWVSATSVLRSSSAVDEVEVCVLDDAGRRGDTVLLATLSRLDPRISVRRASRAVGRPLAVNLALAGSSGSLIVLLQAGVELWPGWAEPLTAALADLHVCAAQPLVLRPDGRLASAGLGASVEPELVGLHAEDARRAGDRPVVWAGDDLVTAVRAADVIAVRGLDPLFHGSFANADLTLRLGRDRVTVTATAALAAVADRLRPGAPLAVAAGRPSERSTPAEHQSDAELLAARHLDRLTQPELELSLCSSAGFELRNGEVRRAAAMVQVSEPAPSLRWVIKTAMPARPDRGRWGDLHFARALAGALEALGQQVVIDHRPAMATAPGPDDDVLLVLRGLEPAPIAQPGSGPVRLMWVISHPELVGDAELRAHDHVFAASSGWAEAARARTGAVITPLLQATDPVLFHPGGGAEDLGERVLFVGNSRKIYRPAVRTLIEAGVQVGVYGAMWEPFLPPGTLRGTFVPNDRLAALYQSAGIVLNDHWDDMREKGFISNRLFDAAACGARVVSDHIDGIPELFEGLVRTYRTPQELPAIVREGAAGYPDQAARRRLGEQIGQRHSFAARAHTLLATAAALHRRSAEPVRR